MSKLQLKKTGHGQELLVSKIDFVRKAMKENPNITINGLQEAYRARFIADLSIHTATNYYHQVKNEMKKGAKNDNVFVNYSGKKKDAKKIMKMQDSKESISMSELQEIIELRDSNIEDILSLMGNEAFMNISDFHEWQEIQDAVQIVNKIGISKVKLVLEAIAY